jgi:hypothetical protein
MFKISNGHAPDYLRELSPQKHEVMSQYSTVTKIKFTFQEAD